MYQMQSKFKLYPKASETDGMGLFFSSTERENLCKYKIFIKHRCVSKLWGIFTKKSGTWMEIRIKGVKLTIAKLEVHEIKI